MTSPYNFQEAIDFTQQFVKINSYELQGKHEIILLIEQILKTRTPAEVTVYDLDTEDPFLIAKVVQDNPSYQLLLEGHLDVVSPEDMQAPFEAIIKDDIMYGRGTADMKAGCAAILSAFIATTNEPLSGDLYLVYTTDEEYAGEKIKTIMEKQLVPKVDFVMIPEPTDGQICHAHKGEAWIEIEFFGKSAHSSKPHLGENAIYMATDFMTHLRQLLQTYEREHKSEYGSLTLSVGLIEGGTAPNIVPAYAKMTIDVRYLPGQEVLEFETDLIKLFDVCKSANASFDAKLTTIGNWNALYTDASNEHLLKIKDILGHSLNREILLSSWPAWGEGGFINKYGIPTVYFGPGEMKYPHTSNEQIKLNDITDLTKAYYDVICQLCK